MRCEGLKTVNCKAITPPLFSGDYHFSESYKLTDINVPVNSVEDYKKADGWKKYADKIKGYAF